MEAEQPRKYEKGDGRKKHVGKNSVPELRSVDGSPRHTRGLCPNNIPEEEKERLLNLAVPVPNRDFEAPAPRMLFVVHRGAVYAARTSNQGISYHAYPYKGKLTSTLLEQLGEMAEKEGCVEEFEKWCKMNITRHGR